MVPLFLLFDMLLELGVVMFHMGGTQKRVLLIVDTIIIHKNNKKGTVFSKNYYFTTNDIRNAAGDPVFANYMFSLAPNNPLLELFMKWIPGGYWHMYLVIPILVVYLLIVYAPEIIGYFKKQPQLPN